MKCDNAEGDPTENVQRSGRESTSFASFVLVIYQDPFTSAYVNNLPWCRLSFLFGGDGNANNRAMT